MLYFWSEPDAQKEAVFLALLSAYKLCTSLCLSRYNYVHFSLLPMNLNKMKSEFCYIFEQLKKFIPRLDYSEMFFE